MPIRLYDLAGADRARRFSPYGWRAKYALAHKGLEFETVATRFLEISGIEDGSYKTVPVLVDGTRTVVDSWAIADYLDDAYGDRPPLVAGPAGRALTRFVDNWTQTVLYAQIMRMVILDIHRHLDAENQAYFRRSREERFGHSLEDMQAGREDRLEAFRKSLQPLRLCLKDGPYLAGDRPMYADYIVLSGFLWARAVSGFQLLAPDDPVHAWLERCCDLYNGLGNRMPAPAGAA